MHLPQAPNPLSANRLINVGIVATPGPAFSDAVDHQYPLGFATGRVHFDANVYRSTSGDPTLMGKFFLPNGRLAPTDIDISRVWARNLLKEQHIFYQSGSGAYPFGIYDEPRTSGVETTLTF